MNDGEVSSTPIYGDAMSYAPNQIDAKIMSIPLIQSTKISSGPQVVKLDRHLFNGAERSEDTVCNYLTTYGTPRLDLRRSVDRFLLDLRHMRCGIDPYS